VGERTVSMGGELETPVALPAVILEGQGTADRLSTLEWIARASDDTIARRIDQLPWTLDFREHAALFLNVYQNALPGVESGFPMVLKNGRLEYPGMLTSHSRYMPFIDGGRFVGTFHVHPSVTGSASAPFFDPQDLGSALRSDNAGFIYLLLARDRLFALVRTNPFLYISAHHVNRNPLLLLEQHSELIRASGSREPGDPDYDEHFRRAGLYFFARYDLALYEGVPRAPLSRTVSPRRNW